MSFIGPVPRPEDLRDIRYLLTDIDDTWISASIASRGFVDIARTLLAAKG